MQVSRFAICADLVEERGLARDLGPLAIFEGSIISQYVCFMKISERTSSTIYTYLIHLARGLRNLRGLLSYNKAWAQRMPWVASYEHRAGTFRPIPVSQQDMRTWLERMEASSGVLVELCKQAKVEREQGKTVGQASFRSRWESGSLMCVMHMQFASLPYLTRAQVMVQLLLMRIMHR